MAGGSDTVQATATAKTTPAKTFRCWKDWKRSASGPAMYIGDTGHARPAPPGLRDRRQLHRRGDGRATATRSPSRINADGSCTVDRRRPRHPRGHAPQEEGKPAARGRPDQAARRRQVRPRDATRSPAACTAWASRWSTPCPSGWRSRSAATARSTRWSSSAASRRRPSKVIGKRARPARTITFKPDSEIFPETRVPYEVLSQRLRELAYLNAGLTITLARRAHRQDATTFKLRGRLVEFVKHLNEGKHAAPHEAGRSSTEDDGAASLVEVALQYNDGYNETHLLLRQQHQHASRAARTCPASRPP